MATKTTPTVRVTRVQPSKLTRSVYIDCPFCGLEHSHGWPYEREDQDPGVRLSHCGIGPYRIVQAAA